MKNQILFTVENDEGDEDEIQIPAKWEICDRCHGNGTRVNPNIDGHGMTAEEWADFGEEEREMYMNGGYDVQCEAGCRDGKILVPDENCCGREPHKTNLVIYYKQREQKARELREDRRTLYMESGGNEGSW